MTARTRFWVDALALASLTTTVGSGLVLLLAFHVGHGPFRLEALGWSRLAWQNLH